MPTDTEAKYNAAQFEKKSHIPQIIGCIDSTHIPILAPANGFRDFVNRKGWSSYNVQAIVDHNGRFINIFAKYPGSAHDARVFKETAIYKHANQLLPQGSRVVDGIDIPYMIIGDPAYPLLPWLLKEYPGTVTPAEESFNVYLNSARVSVEMAFGRLKARWRILLKIIDLDYRFIPSVIVACCALHNMAEKNKDRFLLKWLEECNNGNDVYHQPPCTLNRTKADMNATVLRDNLMRYMSTHFPLRKSLFKQ